MSGEYDPEQAPVGPDLVTVRKTIEVAGLVIGRRIDDPEAFELTLDPDTGELPVLPVDPESDGGEAAVPETASDQRRGKKPGLPFSAQRPIIFSGTSAGFFESELTHGSLTRVKRAAVSSTAMPHATITDMLLVGRIMEQRQGEQPAIVASEVRRAVDNRRTRDRIYGHVNGARALGPHVVLSLDSHTREPLMEDVEHLCDYFGIPFDPEEYFPHITVAKMATEAKAERMAKGLHRLIHTAEDKEPRAIGLGGIMVLNAR